MKKSKFTEVQIIFAPKQAETGVPVEDVSRKMRISEATFYNWKKKYGRDATRQQLTVRNGHRSKLRTNAGRWILSLTSCSTGGNSGP